MSSPDADPDAPSVSEEGLSLLPPEAEVTAYRSRAELPYRLGRFVLAGLGGILVVAGAGLYLRYAFSPYLGLLVFGVIVAALGLAQHVLLRRDRVRWPGQASLWGDGLELVLSTGEVLAVPWSDPKFVLDLYARPMPRGAPDEIVLVWKMDSAVPVFPITHTGFQRIRQSALAHGLEFAEYHASNRKRTLRGYEVRCRGGAEHRVSSPTDINQAAL